MDAGYIEGVGHAYDVCRSLYFAYMRTYWGFSLEYMSGLYCIKAFDEMTFGLRISMEQFFQ